MKIRPPMDDPASAYLDWRLEQQADEMATLRLRIKAVEDVAILWQQHLATESAKRRHSQESNKPEGQTR